MMMVLMMIMVFMGMIMIMVLMVMLILTRGREGTPEFSCCCWRLLCWWTSLVDHLVTIIMIMLIKM